ncbi:MAG: hypothetical protein AAGB24_13400 [Bacteroidota bacterium]
MSNMENLPPKNTNMPSNEIDLRQLLQLIRRGFQILFESFLRLFWHLKKNSIVLGGLIIFGVLLGWGLNQIIEKKIKTEVIVKPNLESKDFLYNTVDEINANIKAKDINFFNQLGIHIASFKGLEITVEPLGVKSYNSKENFEYLELLEKFQNAGFVSDVLRAEILKNSPVNHKITFYYKNLEEGNQFCEKIAGYINSNNYFKQLVDTYRQNAFDRIEKNEILIEQIDVLINSYSKSLQQDKTGLTSGQILLENEEQLDITGLFQLKNKLIEDIEQKKLEIKRRENPITIINFGKPQEVEASFFGQTIVLIPLILVALFFLFSFVKYLNKKSAALVIQ